MIKKTIKFHNLDGVEVTEDFYFAMSLNETLAEAADGSFVQKAQTLAQGGADGATIYKNFSYILEKAIGRRSPDGEYLVKSPQITQAFMNSDAFSVLLFELLADAGKAAEFFTGIFPKNLAEKIAELSGNQEPLPFSEVAGKVDLPVDRSPESYSQMEIMEMSQEEFTRVFGPKPEKWPRNALVGAMQRRIDSK